MRGRMTSPLVDVRALVVAVVGSARSGKALLLSALIGEVPSSGGMVRIPGHDLSTERNGVLAHEPRSYFTATRRS